MRRTDREITEYSLIKAIIKNAKVCRLGMVNGKNPYIVPLCFGFKDKVLYFHSALKGQKMEFIRENPSVCFEFDSVLEVLESEDACAWGMKYQSVIGFGRAQFIEDLDDKRKALSIIMAQYSEQDYKFPDNQVKATAVFKVEIKSMTGKQSGF